MRLAKLTLITLTLGMFVLAGCGKKDEKKTDQAPTADKTAPADKGGEVKAPDTKPVAPVGAMTKEQMAEKMIGFFDNVIAAAKKNSEDCDAMAVELKKLVDEARPLMAQAKEMEEKDPGAKEWFETTHGKAIEEKMMRELMPAMAKCAEHEGVNAAMEGLE